MNDKIKYDVGGKSIQDIMNITKGDFLSFDISSQRKIVGRLVSASNKRARRVLNSGRKITLKSYVKKGKFSVKGLNSAEELWKEQERATEYLSRKTSTLRGIKEVEEELKSSPIIYVVDEKAPGGVIGLEFSKYEDLETGNVWEAFEKVLATKVQEQEDKINSRHDFSKSVVYKMHEATADFMVDNNINSIEDFKDEDREKLKTIFNQIIINN